ncbi:hypothetical protein [Arthrobacter sp. zg-Y1110]|uniref:hypothetical protein n=1 Tax=Arthrobacter sp. zg-Y1110 TaxID=2886932 RepID=UPI001D14A5D1|nr:hypothetical protein [Arthrobacter sp. zg-Y1110]MCC3292494.1 hypothetical protein [Arthrobacter sp. zg-Y1110]UWX87074.1 hypothetical protein N2K99_17125 [Arthrobacter sp. zg-Y1110]
MSSMPMLPLPTRQAPDTDDVQVLKARILELEELAFRRGRGLHILHRHLSTGGTDHAILLGVVENTLTGYSPSSVAEAKALTDAAAAA